MANYYYVTIKSDKMTQQVASEIFNRLASSCLIRCIEFNEGYLFYNSRGLIDIEDILNKYNFNDDEVKIEDEFSLPFTDIPPMRDQAEVIKYEKEAFDKVWLMRTRPCEEENIEIQRQSAMAKILAKYDDIPEEGYSDWECGYWNGVMATLRWVLGDEEKDNLDT